ncbi:hypothetical protein GOM49_00480 [Clostridium bovifaecis]|uniref:Uncharacterized protein n=1 Tax=Clostridium bovifaecis TaxID=2184719 RepID=A0A6I6F7V4_9CLOT|nr:hypothetical protein GOM49_00480 [Clostridium bovifaecis]
MGKLLKYEIKGNYKLFLGMFAITALLNILLLTRIHVWNTGIIVALFSMVSVALFVVALVFVVNSFKNEMYEDRGYLTFTLPVSGNKILASKIIAAVIWFIGAGILTLIFARILVGYADPEVITQINMYVNTKAVFLLSTLFSLINLIMILLMIYFSITVTRVALRKKKMSGFLGFLAFILLNIIIFYIDYKIVQLFPQAISLKLGFLDGTQTSVGLLKVDNQSMISINNASLDINIASVIYNIIVYIGLFLSTGYLIDNKIDI